MAVNGRTVRSRRRGLPKTQGIHEGSTYGQQPPRRSWRSEPQRDGALHGAGAARRGRATRHAQPGRRRRRAGDARSAGGGALRRSRTGLPGVYAGRERVHGCRGGSVRRRNGDPRPRAVAPLQPRGRTGSAAGRIVRSSSAPRDAIGVGAPSNRAKKRLAWYAYQRRDLRGSAALHADVRSRGSRTSGGWGSASPSPSSRTASNGFPRHPQRALAGHRSDRPCFSPASTP